MSGKGLYEKWGLIVACLVVLSVITGIAMKYRLLPGLDGEDDGDLTGMMGVEIFVTYANGDTKTIAPENPLSAFTLGITGLIGGEISNLEPRVKYKANWAGTLSHWEITGWLKTYMDGTLIDDRAIIENPTTDHVIAKGFYKEIASLSYTASELEDLAFTEGRHEMRVAGFLLLKITFADGDDDTKSASHDIVYKFDYVEDAPLSMITEFSIQSYAYPTFQ